MEIQRATKRDHRSSLLKRQKLVGFIRCLPEDEDERYKFLYSLMRQLRRLLLSFGKMKKRKIKRRLLKQQKEQKCRHELVQCEKKSEERLLLQWMAEEHRLQEKHEAEVKYPWQVAQKQLRRQQELERENERQRENEQLRKAIAQACAERAHQEQTQFREREKKVQKGLEKLKELERERLAKMAAQEEEKRKKQAEIMHITEEHKQKLQKLALNVVLSSTYTTVPSSAVPQIQPNISLHLISPVHQKKCSLENYDIDELNSDDSTDDDESPRKEIPSWAQDASLKATVIKQAHHPPDLDAIFSYVESPDLNEMFDRKLVRFTKRTSSAFWTSP